MKQFKVFGLVVFAAVALTACKDANFKTTASGLKYKIIDGGGDDKDSTKDGYILKMNQTVRLSGSKDTLVYESYGKMPFFAPVQSIQNNPGQPVYGPEEVYKQLKKGDSLIAIVFYDSLIKKGMPAAQLPPFFKKGDKITLTYKVLEVFKSDSLARIDYQKEMEKDAPRQQKEEAEQREKAIKEMEAQQKIDDAAIEKSGEKAKQIAVIETYLKGKGIAATKTPLGTFVKIDNPGTGAQVTDGKFVTLNLTGKKIENDSTFNPPTSFTVQIGKGGSIRGFEDGLKQFKQGGKGTIYVPGYLAYGKNPPQGSPFKTYEPLYFNVEISGVSDTEPAPQQPPAVVAPPTDAKKEAPKKKK